MSADEKKALVPAPHLSIVRHVGTRVFRSVSAITGKREDQLDRSSFASAIARGLLGWRGEESLVVALTGEWGTGKSSVKNIVLEELSAMHEADRPQLLEFNPWQWSGNDVVGTAFLREVGVALGKESAEQQNQRTAAAWRSYAARLMAGAYLAETVGITAIHAALVFSVAAVVLANAFPTFKVVGLSLAAAALILTAFLRRGGKFAELVASSFEARAKASDKTTSEAREELKVALRTRDRPLLIVMDDVDRLTSTEVAQVFQLVKSSADLPNIIYFLLYQRDLVERSLEQVAPKAGHGYGRAFLEKIVQVSFTMPKIEHARLETILIAGLNEILGDPAMDRHFDQKRWTGIYSNALRPYFRTVRDVHRFLNTLDFHAGVFRGANALEVNPVDLIALEVMRVFEPDVYSAIGNLKGILTGDDLSVRLDDKPSDENKAAVRGIIDAARDERKEEVRGLIYQLFPRSRPFLDGTAPSNEDDSWLQHLRACHPDVFDRYFQFGIPTGDLSREELDRLLALTGDADALTGALVALHGRALLVTAIDRLESFKLEIPSEHTATVAEALFNIGDDLPDTVLRYAMSADMLAARIIHFTAKRLPKGGPRKDHLAKAFDRTKGISLPARLLTWLDPARRETEEKSEQIVSASEFDEIKHIFLAKLEQPSVRSSLASNSRLAWLLYRWRDYAGINAPRAYVKELTQTPDGALQFITAMTRRVVSTGMERYTTPTVTFDIKRKDLTTFIEISTLADRLAGVDVLSLGEAQRNAIAAFGIAKSMSDSESEEDAT